MTSVSYVGSWHQHVVWRPATSQGTVWQFGPCGSMCAGIKAGILLHQMGNYPATQQAVQANHTANCVCSVDVCFMFVMKRHVIHRTMQTLAVAGMLHLQGCSGDGHHNCIPHIVRCCMWLTSIESKVKAHCTASCPRHIKTQSKADTQ